MYGATVVTGVVVVKASVLFILTNVSVEIPDKLAAAIIADSGIRPFASRRTVAPRNQQTPK